jgi:7-cyano-7-deazaguanine synthase in queuosine biosynthesis
LYISFAVFAADRLCSRNDSLDGWSRELKLSIPVLENDIWQRSKSHLEDMLDFLSGDHWEIEFRPRTESGIEQYYKKRWEKSPVKGVPFDNVCMFSGGLDSFIGAIDILEHAQKNQRTLFVSHYGGGKGTKEYQDYLIKEFYEKYGRDACDFQQFHAAIVNGVEETTRTRSFMFFSHAIALASTLGREVRLIIPENGLISLNIPATFSRIGTSSTRTTHPYYIKKFQDLLDAIGLPVRLENPYQFKTKGEMLIQCNGQDFMKKNVPHTMSCSHPDVGRRRGETHAMHCGYCLPCIIRRAAILKAGVIDTSFYYDPKCEKVNVAKTNLNSYRQGIRKFDPMFAFMSIQQNGPIEDNIDDFADLYVRGMEEVKLYLEGIQ